jgi:hypothetical protein
MEAKIWRYMDFTKFVSALSKNALFFTRMDLLDDPFEGSLPKAFYSNFKPFTKGNSTDKEIRKAKNSLDRTFSKLSKANRKLVFINSWHVNEYESAAMWRLYIKSNEGIAFQSTFKRLSGSFVQKENVGFGLINYVDDYNNEKINDFSGINLNMVRFPCMYKRNCFEYEKELRAVIFTSPVTEQAKKAYYSKLALRGIPEGLDIAVELPTLIEKIYVSPTAGKWFLELVSSVVEKYGFNIQVEPSSLAVNPTF